MFTQVARLKTGVQGIVSDYEGDNPRTLGRVYQVVGGLLVADGLVGLENPFDSKKSRPGILGAALLMVIGLVITVVGSFVITVAKTDAMVAGAVSQISAPQQGSDGSAATCSYQASYVVDGKTYTARSSVSSSGACNKVIGSTVDVRYLSSNPAQGVLDAGTTKMFRWGAILGGLVLIGAGGLTFLIRAAAIFFGVKLFLRGRKMLKDNPADGTEEPHIIDTAKDAFMRLRFGKPTTTSAVDVPQP